MGVNRPPKTTEVNRAPEIVGANRPRVLVIAGFDQSGGAGVLSDIKTLEMHGVYGYAVVTGLTFQHERKISRVHWYTEKEIFEQIDLCFESAGAWRGEGSETAATGKDGSPGPAAIGKDESSGPAATGKDGSSETAATGKDESPGPATTGKDRSSKPAAIGKDGSPGPAATGGKGSNDPGGFDWVKIGVGRSIAMLQSIIGHLRAHHPAIRIVLDPVIRASSGKDFWEGADREGFDALARQCWLVTPNWDEIGWLYPGEDIPEVCRRLSGHCNLYLKGGHHPQLPGRDYLWSGGMLQVLEPTVDPGYVFPKHGSGCVLSSSLAANLALGYTLWEAAVRSKRYIEQFLTSNKTYLGWHQLPAKTVL